MLTKKKKISKKEIKEDKLVTTYYKSLDFFNQHKNKIYLYGGIVVVVFAAIFWYVDNKAKNDDKASTELGKILASYEKGAYQEAINGKPAEKILGLKQIVDEYGSTETGEVAKIFLANSYSMMGKTEDAFKYYDDYSGDNKVFKATALAGKAGYYESKNEYQKAADLFLEAAHQSEENALNAEYLLKAGINFIDAGQKDKAKEALKSLKDEYKTSSAVREVDRYLALVKE